MTDFLDLLEAYHHWCVTGDRTHLECSQEWLTTAVAIPDDETGCGNSSIAPALTSYDRARRVMRGAGALESERRD